MSDPRDVERSDQPTGEDLTVRPDAVGPQSQGATEDEFVPVGGPRSGDAEVGGTEDVGIEPEDEITPG